MKVKAKKSALQLDDSFAYVIYRSARLLRYSFGHFTARLGLDIGQEQFFILHRLGERPQQAQNELCDGLIGDRPNITRMIATMERNGWLRREEDPDDARKLRVSLTPLGAATLNKVQNAVIDERRRLFAGLTNADLDDLKRIVTQIEKNVRLHD